MDQTAERPVTVHPCPHTQIHGQPGLAIAIREKFEARHPIGSAARTCYALGFWLGNRRGDVAALDWEHLVVEEVELFDGSIEVIEAFDFRQKKNRNRHGGREMFIPIVDKLAQALAPLDRSNGGAVLKNAFGLPRSKTRCYAAKDAAASHQMSERNRTELKGGFLAAFFMGPLWAHNVLGRGTFSVIKSKVMVGPEGLEPPTKRL